MDNLYQKHFFIGALKNLLKFSNHFKKRIYGQKQPFSGVLHDRYPEKVFKIHQKTSMLESLLNSLQKKETSAQVFSCDLCKAFKNTYFTEHPRWSWSLSQKMFYIVSVHRKVFEWLAANELCLRAKTICALLVSPFLIFPFSL